MMDTMTAAELRRTKDALVRHVEQTEAIAKAYRVRWGDATDWEVRRAAELQTLADDTRSALAKVIAEIDRRPRVEP